MCVSIYIYIDTLYIYKTTNTLLHSLFFPITKKNTLKTTLYILKNHHMNTKKGNFYSYLGN